MIKYLFLFFLLCLSLVAKADINNIPGKDLEKIKHLFEELIDQHDYSYTIFGSKPMSLADFGLKVPDDLPIHRRLRSWYYLMRRKAWLQAWYKHRDEFDLKDFIFLDEEKDLFQCLVLVLINKKNMLNVLREHKAIFKEELGDSFTSESFLEKLEKRETSLVRAIHDSDKLLGIMLGYGVRNATLFQERFDLIKAISKRKKDLPQEELTQKLNIIESQSGDFSEFEADPVISPLYFLADTTHPETISLKEKYTQDRQSIKVLMQQPRFMDVVLRRLTRHQ